MNKRKLDIILMVLGLLTITVFVPLTISAMSSANTLLTTNYDYSQVENETGFYDGPIVDGVATEGKILTGGSTGTNISEETVTWDSVSEWDTLTVTTVNTDATIFFNLNDTVNEIYDSSTSKFRFKVNSSFDMTGTLYVCVFDGVDLVKTKAWEKHIGNGSQEVTYNFTATEILSLKTQARPEKTDEVFWQWALTTTDDSVSNFTTGSSIQFQMAWGTPDNVFTLSSSTIIQFVAGIGAFFFFFIAIASTKWFNPLQKGATGGLFSKGVKWGVGRRKARRS